MALNNVDLVIRPGETFGLLGPLRGLGWRQKPPSWRSVQMPLTTRLRQHRTRRHFRASAIADPDGTQAVSLCPGGNGRMVVAESSRRKRQDRVKAGAKRAEQARRRAKAEREQQTAER